MLLCLLVWFIRLVKFDCIILVLAKVEDNIFFAIFTKNEFYNTDNPREPIIVNIEFFNYLFFLEAHYFIMSEIWQETKNLCNCLLPYKIIRNYFRPWKIVVMFIEKCKTISQIAISACPSDLLHVMLETLWDIKMNNTLDARKVKTHG